MEQKKIELLEEKVEFYEYVLNNLNAGIWVNSYNSSLWHNKKTSEILDHSPEEINKMGVEEYQRRYYHPDDAGIFEESYEYLCDENIGVATFIYRQKDKNGDWKYILATGKVSKRMANGLPEESVNCGIDITEKFAEFTKVESLLKENAFLKSKIKLKELTKRELEVLKRITQGLSSKQIAEKENISFHTVETHRKKISKKLNINNLADLVRFATECGV